MSFLQALVMGLVQGLGEFLPISSSAHLVLVPWFFRWPDPGISFDVALHFGTLLSLLTVFWRDWIVLIRDGLGFKRTPGRRLFWYLVVATIPGALFGYLLEDLITTVFRHPPLIALMLVVMGVFLYMSDRLSPAKKGISQVGWRESLWIGLSQAFALIPGVSRSGITMATGRLMGLNRETAARFSFLLSTPIVAGAALVQFSDLTPADLTMPFFAGVFLSALVGFVAIKFLLRFLVTNSFAVFVIYRFILGAAVIALSYQRGIFPF